MGRVSDARERLMSAVQELIWTGSYGSTTIDQICEKAGVKKGSFYYFFSSKADVAEASLGAEWERHRAELDRIFSPTVPPLERLTQYCHYGYEFQAKIRNKFGNVLGCPLFSLGAEVSTQEDKLQKKVQAILNQKRKYLESAIRDAAAAGLVKVKDPAQKARVLFAYYQGLATQARIENKLDGLRDAIGGTFDLLGIEEPKSIAA
jgi:TetR/AcrR family transcriptional repressor of nem operon